MKQDLLEAFASDEVLEEVDGEVVTVAEVSFNVDGEEDVDLFLGTELGGEGRSSEVSLLGIDLLHHKAGFN